MPDEVILPSDDAWPGLFDRMAQPPKLLFRRGRLDLLDCLASRQAVAVVGTRSASPHGIQWRRSLAMPWLAPAGLSSAGSLKALMPQFMGDVFRPMEHPWLFWEQVSIASIPVITGLCRKWCRNRDC